MTVKTGASWSGAFVTKSATGAVTAATGTPVGTLYVDGTANGASVTVGGANPYSWTVTLPALTAGQRVDMYITATVSAVATGGIVASEQADTELVSDLTDEVIGTGSGLTALGDTRLANLDAAVSTRSTYAGGAVASVTGDVGGNVTGSVGSISAGGITAASLATAAVNKIADILARRHTSDIEASSDGDTLSGKSLYGAIARLAHKVSVSGSTMTITKADDAAALTTATLTTDASADPITVVDPS